MRESIENEEGEGMKEKKSFASGLITGLSIALIIVIGVYGVKMYRLSNPLRNAQETSAETQTETVVTKETEEKMKLLEDTINKYFLEETDNTKMQEGVYRGLVDALEDPYSIYYSPAELEEIKKETEGIYYGIGAYVGMDTELGYTKITKFIEGSPAQASGMQVGDYIYKVDGKSTQGLTSTEVVSLIKGEEGTPVMITVVRENVVEPIDIEVVRTKIESPTVSWQMLDENIGYILINEFDQVTIEQFDSAMEGVRAGNMKGLILDLRNNPGGNMSAVTEIAGHILPKGLIVYTEDKEGTKVEYDSDGTHALEVPLVVLINENSASAAEILSGAIKDYGVGTLLGTTTFGKGIVQRIITFSDGSAVKLTVSKYYTPNGNNIHEKGIEPDEELELDVEKYVSTGEDNQLERAMDIINEQLGTEKAQGEEETDTAAEGTDAEIMEAVE